MDYSLWSCRKSGNSQSSVLNFNYKIIIKKLFFFIFFLVFFGSTVLSFFLHMSLASDTTKHSVHAVFLMVQRSMIGYDNE